MQTNRMLDPVLKKLLSEWAVLDNLYANMKDSDVREAIIARRSQLRSQIAALVEERRAA